MGLLGEGGGAAPETGRVVSIDVFRGLTIFLMIFVNTVAGVSNIPLWLKHAPADADGTIRAGAEKVGSSRSELPTVVNACSD